MLHARKIIAAVVAPMLAVTAAWAQTAPMQGPMHEWWWHGWWPFGGIFWLAFLVLAFLGLVSVVRRLSGGEGSDGRSSSALAILDERYARGEINREEYEERRRDLRR